MRFLAGSALLGRRVTLALRVLRVRRDLLGLRGCRVLPVRLGLVLRLRVLFRRTPICLRVRLRVTGM